MKKELIERAKRQTLNRMSALELKPEEMTLEKAKTLGYRQHTIVCDAIDFPTHDEAQKAGYHLSDDGYYYKNVYARPINVSEEEYTQVVPILLDNFYSEKTIEMQRTLSSMNNKMTFFVWVVVLYVIFWIVSVFIAAIN